MSLMTTDINRNYKVIVFSFMNYHHVCSKSNMAGSVTGSAYHSGTPEFIPCFTGVGVPQSV